MPRACSPSRKRPRALKDPFLARALQNIADGTDAEDLRMQMEDEIDTKSRSDHASSKFFASLGGYAPTVGIVGTVVSLTHVLENLSKPDELGHMIAAAFVATLWGLLSANFIWLPFSSRLARLSELEHRTHDPRDGGHARRAVRCPAAAAGRTAPVHGPRTPAQERRQPATRRRAVTGCRGVDGHGRVSGRRRPRKKPEAHHVDERWMASYMDMVTVLMCLFIVLYAMSTVDANKFEKLRNSLATGFGTVASETVDTASGTVVPPEFVDKDLEAFAAVQPDGKNGPRTRGPRRGQEGSGPAAGPARRR